MRGNSVIKRVLTVVLAFFLSIVIFVMSVCVVAKATVFNKSFIMNCMDKCGYFSDLDHEIKQSLTDLGYASGLDEDFSESIFDEVFLKEQTDKYLDAYYSGESTVVDTVDFEQKFSTALDNYISDKNIDPDTVNSNSRYVLTKNAAEIFKNNIKIPMFTTIANYFYKAQFGLTVIIISSAVLTVLIAVTMLLLNKWRHRFYRNLSYGCLGATLAVLIIPVAGYISGFASKVNFTQRSAYNLFVTTVNQCLAGFLLAAAVLVIISLILILLYRRSYNKVK